MCKRSFQVSGCIILALTCSMVNAALVSYTDQSTFMAALTGTSTTLNLNSLPIPTTINSGDTVNGITFTYNFSTTDLVVTDGNQFSGGGSFDTTSGSNFLGTNDADILQDDDDFTLAFSATNAIGIYFITADMPNVTLFNNDIQLTVGTTTALLDVSAIQQTLSDGSLVYFLGIIDTTGSFTTASIDTPNSSGSFLYNIGDIITSVAPLVSLPADLDDDGDVDMDDLNIVIGCFGQTVADNPNCDVADVAPPPGSDGVINILDISFVSSYFTP